MTARFLANLVRKPVFLEIMSDFPFMLSNLQITTMFSFTTFPVFSDFCHSDPGTLNLQ